jgi:hypothetical protein
MLHHLHCAWLELNQQPGNYEFHALTIELQAQITEPATRIELVTSRYECGVFPSKLHRHLSSILGVRLKAEILRDITAPVTRVVRFSLFGSTHRGRPLFPSISRLTGELNFMKTTNHRLSGFHVIAYLSQGVAHDQSLNFLRTTVVQVV